MATATMAHPASNRNTIMAQSSTAPFHASSPAMIASSPAFSLPPGAIVQPHPNGFALPHVSMSMTGFPSIGATVPGTATYNGLPGQPQHPYPSPYGYPNGLPQQPHLTYMQQYPALPQQQTKTGGMPPGPHAGKLPSSQQQQPSSFYAQPPPFKRSHSSTGSFSASASSSSSSGNSASVATAQHSRSSSDTIGRTRTQSDKLAQRPSMLKNELVPDSFVAHGHAPRKGGPQDVGLPPQAPFMRDRSDSNSSSASSARQRSNAPTRHHHPRTAGDDDDTPLAYRSRVDSKTSSTSSARHSPHQAQSTASAASDRSITPTASFERPRSSMSTARTATPQPPKSSPLNQPGQASSSPSAESAAQAAAGLTQQPAKDKKTGLEKFKKTFGANDSKKANQRSHQATDSFNSTLSNGSSTSGASTSPPATPPDHSTDLQAPGVYSHANASLSSTTLQSHLDTAASAAAGPADEDEGRPRRRKLSLFNAKMNASTDNISISSTMSSASQVLRKIGTFGGKLSKRSSLASIGTMFHKDKGRDDSDTQSEFGISTASSSGSRLRKGFKRNKGSPAAASVSLATVEQEAPPGHGSLTPAARLAREQQERYAEQEAREKEQQKEREGAGSPAPTEDRRLKLIEKEKNKLNKKNRKFWSKGSFGGAQSVGYAQEGAADARASVDEHGRPLDDTSSDSPTSDGFTLETHSLPMPDLSSPMFDDNLGDFDDQTPRQSVELGAQETLTGQDEVAVRQNGNHPSRPRSVFEDDTGSFTKTHHAAPSTQSVNDSGSEYEGSLYASFQAGKESAPPMPSKAAPRPVRGILKPARSNGREDAHGSSRPPRFERSRSNSANSPNAGPGGAQNMPPQHNFGHQRHGSLQSLGHFLSHDTFDSPQTSPSASVSGLRGPSPYMNANANSSEPLLSVGGKPPMGLRSATSPPSSKRLNFANNLSVHTTWPAGIYDRRGEAATCSRLTPALAQRIKDELNTYKLQEMEVHQSSRIYTHFFS